MDAQAELGARVRHDRVHGLVDRQHVDARHRQRGAGPDALARGRRCRRTAGPARSRPARGTPRRCRRRPSTPRAAARARPRRRARRAVPRARAAATISASGAAPPNCPLCFGPASVRTSTMTPAMPRSATVSVGTPGRTLPMSPITIASAANSCGLRRRVGRERAPRLLLALDHDLDADGRLALPGAQRTDVHQDVRLGVGRAAAEDRAVALARLERRRLPLRLVPDRHDVVVRVQEDRRRARGRGDLTGDDRRRVRQLERAERLDARVAEQADDELVGLEQRRSRVLRDSRRRRCPGPRRGARDRRAAAASAHGRRRRARMARDLRSQSCCFPFATMRRRPQRACFQSSRLVTRVCATHLREARTTATASSRLPAAGAPLRPQPPPSPASSGSRPRVRWR